MILINFCTAVVVLGKSESKSENKNDTFAAKNQQFTYSDIVKITKNFEKVLGKGGFGTVYLGYLDDTEVAVKLLSSSSAQGYKEFHSEVKLLMRVHHRNLTSSLGTVLKAHIWEYLRDWYLHDGCKPPIIHRDVKSSNILLNEKLEAKIADFGVSRIFPIESGSHVCTGVVGTAGYLDPENFEINSAWKAVELALSCTSQSSSERPTMIEVVMELKECLVLAMTPNGEGHPGNKSKGPRRMLSVDVNADEFSPSAR
ncbi:hypothetical protein LWI29_020861 [Acer saccharum]|uniref:Protein kinase domain-containing protein n=1 Tax=Acer saccharum TaxID=4024 RepID=A0AA39SUT3_ACESA|nr:hypothetical protein LWI29_020861 [Acer saccharum]